MTAIQIIKIMTLMRMLRMTILDDGDDEEDISHHHGSDGVALLDAAGAAGNGEEELEAEGGQVLHGEGVLAVQAKLLNPAIDGNEKINFQTCS